MEKQREPRNAPLQKASAPPQAEDRTSFPSESNECTLAWTAAFRKENGDEALINYEQAWEFVDNCRDGKQV